MEICKSSPSGFNVQTRLGATSSSRLRSLTKRDDLESLIWDTGCAKNVEGVCACVYLSVYMTD